MSLRQEWYAAQLQRQQQFLERKQQVAAVLEEVRYASGTLREHHQQLWQEQRQQRTVYVAPIKHSVWGTTPSAGND